MSQEHQVSAQEETGRGLWRSAPFLSTRLVLLGLATALPFPGSPLTDLSSALPSTFSQLKSPVDCRTPEIKSSGVEEGLQMEKRTDAGCRPPGCSHTRNWPVSFLSGYPDQCFAHLASATQDPCVSLQLVRGLFRGRDPSLLTTMERICEVPGHRADTAMHSCTILPR